jgi:hypothetical protein
MSARNKDGTFKSAADADLERQEAEWHAEVKAKMDAGLSFDEAWIAAGGDIMATSESSPESVAEVRKAYANVGIAPRVMRYRGTPP